MDNFFTLLNQLKQPIFITLAIIIAVLAILYFICKTQEQFLFIVKVLFIGIIPIALSGGVCALLIMKFANGHPHGLPGVLNILIGGLALGLWVIAVFFLAFSGKQDMKLALQIAFIICAMQTVGSLFLEL